MLSLLRRFVQFLIFAILKSLLNHSFTIMKAGKQEKSQHFHIVVRIIKKKGMQITFSPENFL